MKVVAFNGSPRKNGNTKTMLKAVCKVLNSEGVETEVIQIGGKPLRGCTSCYSCKERQDKKCIFSDDIINECIEKMVEADGILLGSPTYFASVTPEIKALIDRAGFVTRSNNSLLRRKVGAAVVTARRGGAIHTFDALNHFFTISQMIIPGSSYWNDGIGGHVEGIVEKDTESMECMATLGQNMAWLIKKINK